MEIVPAQDAEVLRLEAGTIDAMVQADVRPEDYAALKRLSQQGTITLTDVGIGIDPERISGSTWRLHRRAPRPATSSSAAFRQAISSAVDRDAIVRSVYLGAGVPVYGPVTPGNRTWYAASTPTFPFDRDRARTLLGTLGLTDRNGDGQLEDAAGAPVRFSILTQRGHLRERTATVIQEQLRQVGVAVDVVASIRRRSSSAGARETTTASISGFRRARWIRRTIWISGSAPARVMSGIRISRPRRRTGRRRSTG